MNYTDFSNELSKMLDGNLDGNVEINDWDVIKRILSHAIENNYHGYGQNIVDFIDRGCWDSISNIQFNDDNRQVEMKWHDGWFYHASIESIIVIQNNEMFFIFIKAYYQDKKTIKHLYALGDGSLNTPKSGNYMIEITRNTGLGEEFIQIPNINCYTTCIMTRPLKGEVTSNYISELLMHEVNLNLAINKFIVLRSEIEGTGEYERDTLQEKGNTARRYFEYVLMLINIREQMPLKQPYQNQMLGKLYNVIKSLNLPSRFEEEIDYAKKLLNQCSHHDGGRIEKKHLLMAVSTLYQFSNWVKNFYLTE